MNSLKRPRRRPRVASVNYRSFFWVLMREAALHVLFHDGQALKPWSSSRRCMVRADAARVRFLVGSELVIHPERRIFP